MIAKDVSQTLHTISFDPHNRKQVFLALPLEMRSKVLLRLPNRILIDLLKQMDNKDLLPVLEYLDPDEATDIIQALSKKRQNEVVSLLSEDLRNSVQLLSQFDPQTAAGLMNIDYIQVDVEGTITEVIKKLKKHEKRTGRVPAIIALKKDRVAGYVPAHRLGLAGLNEQVRKNIQPISTISHKATHQEIISVFTEHPHNKVVVIGNNNSVLGIIYSDDVLRIIKERESSSLYNFAGLSDEEGVTDSTSKKVHSRYRWLIINLGTAFLAASTVSLFEETISKYVLLAVYMPIVAGMGGNAATQTLAVVVRGITLRQIEFKTAWIVLRREVGAGLVNGLINGVIVASVVLFFNKDIKLALVLALAMILNLLVAGAFGTLVPLIMKRLKKDPATSATIFITTATDVLGFLAFLGLAALLL